MIRWLASAAALVWALTGAAIAQSPERVALVVGVQNYTAGWADLTRPVATARAYAANLRARGFEVVDAYDADRAAFTRAVDRFLRLAEEAEIGVFVFVGHGAQLPGDRASYLVPANTPLLGETGRFTLRQDYLVAVDTIREQMKSAGLATRILIIDASRDEIFAPKRPGAQSGARLAEGLRHAEGGTVGEYIIYAAEDGRLALESTGADDRHPHTVFSRHFLPAFRKGVDIRTAFQNSRGAVLREARKRIEGGAPFHQFPVAQDQLLGGCLDAGGCGPQTARAPTPPPAAPAPGPTAPPPAAAPRPDPTAAARTAWEAVKDSRDADAIRAFLRAHPGSPFEAAANAAIEALIADYRAGQTELARLGFYRQRVDGAWGEGSKAALSAWQRAAERPSTDGLLTGTELAALKQAEPPKGRIPTTPGATFKECDVCPTMVVIPGGSFRMGSRDGEPDRRSTEGPVRTVRIRSFALGRTEVTRGDFARFVRETGRSMAGGCVTFEGGDWKRRANRDFRNPGFAQTDRHPVVCVSWEDAQAYVRWLNSKVEGSPYRLPSEAEQEYAIRARTTTAYRWGTDKNAGCRFANGHDATSRRVNRFSWTASSCDDDYVQTAPVGSFRANGFGLSDMVGNVWEWGADCWNGDYRGAPGDGRAWMSGNCSRAVLRGGSWSDEPRYLRSADRLMSLRGDRYSYVGFRVARTFTR